MTQGRIFAAIILTLLGWAAMVIAFGKMAIYIPVLVLGSLILLFAITGLFWAIAGDIAKAYEGRKNDSARN